MLDREFLLSSGWSRGAIIDLQSGYNQKVISALPQKIQDHIKGKEAYAIVTLYDCAVIYDCLEKEPWIYFLVAIKADVENPAYLLGKNERNLQFQIATDSGEKKLLEVNALSCQLSCDRGVIADAIVLKDTKVKELSTLLTWVADRTLRPVFSDEFNSDVKVKAEKAFKDARMKNISAIFVKITNLEEDKNKKEVSIFLTVDNEKIGVREYRELMNGKVNEQTICERMVSIFPTIKYKATCNLIPENEISLKIMKSYQKWAPDYFTNRLEQGEKSPIPNLNFVS